MNLPFEWDQIISRPYHNRNKYFLFLTWAWQPSQRCCNASTPFYFSGLFVYTLHYLLYRFPENVEYVKMNGEKFDLKTYFLSWVNSARALRLIRSLLILVCSRSASQRTTQALASKAVSFNTLASSLSQQKLGYIVKVFLTMSICQHMLQVVVVAREKSQMLCWLGAKVWTNVNYWNSMVKL